MQEIEIILLVVALQMTYLNVSADITGPLKSCVNRKLVLYSYAALSLCVSLRNGAVL